MFSRYRLLRFLGEAPPDTVCLARDDGRSSHVVLHILPEDFLAVHSDHLDRLEQVLESLQIDPIPGTPTLGSYDLRSTPAGFTEEYLKGENLRHMLDRCRNEHQKLAYGAVTRTLKQLAIILHQAHQARIFHGDLRPAKVLVDKHDTRLIGFPWAGLRPFTAEEMSEATATVLPPEALDGALPDQRWDLYQLGLIAYEMYTGHRPFPELSGMAAAEKRAKAPIPPLGHCRHYCPRELQEIVMNLLELDPPKRPPSVRAFTAYLDGYLKRAKRGPISLVEPLPLLPEAPSPVPTPKLDMTISEKAPLMHQASPLENTPPAPAEYNDDITRALRVLTPSIEILLACILFVVSSFLILTTPRQEPGHNIKIVPATTVDCTRGAP